MTKALTALTFVLALATTIMVFSQDRLFDAGSFATTATSTLQEPAVNEYLSEQITEALVDQAPDLAIGGPLLTEITGVVLQSNVAATVIEAATADAHQAIFKQSADSLVLELSDLVVTIEHAVSAANPELAESIPAQVSQLSVEISSGELSLRTARLAKRMQLLTIVLVIATMVALAVLVATETSMFVGFARMGLVLGSVGLFLVVLRAVGAGVVSTYGRTDLESDAFAGAWNVVLGDLAIWGWALIFAGAFLAGLGWAVLNAGRLGDVVATLRERVVTEPTSRVGRLGRTLAILVVALWALVSPNTLLGTAIRVAGFALAIIVVARLVDAIGVAERLNRLQLKATQVSSPKTVAGQAAVPIVVMIALGIVGAMLLSANDGASALGDPDACNGHVELCDRRLDQVTMAASHNSMSSTGTDFYLPNQLSTIRAQLDQGVRGFLIDTVYGRRADNGSVRTSLDLVDVDTLDDVARSTAAAVRARQGPTLGEETVFLCHSFCEIGALDAVAELTSLRLWLENHPREVIVVIVQDATSPDDTAAIFADAGLADMVLTQDRDQPFPTLGEMIDSNQRVFIMVEEDGTGFDWLHGAFEFSQETPYSFASAEEFSCAPNRGEPESPLFVVNHFITLARPSNYRINTYEPLLERAEACLDERGLQPNLLAVDFVAKGDVMAVVDELNGVD